MGERGRKGRGDLGEGREGRMIEREWLREVMGEKRRERHEGRHGKEVGEGRAEWGKWGKERRVVRGSHS